MMLIIHFTNDHYRLCLLEGRASRWFEEGPVSGKHALLSRVLKSCDRSKKFPRAIAVTLQVRKSLTAPQNVSWSTVRAAVAMANTLSFAWNVPVVEALVSGDENERELVEIAKKAAKSGAKGMWVRAKYGGEPNITKAKAVL